LVQEELHRKEEEIAQKCVSLTVNASKMTVQTLKNMLQKYLEAQQNGSPKIYKGKQSVKQLTNSGAKLTNIEITDQNIKSFCRTARKYGIDFALRKDNFSTPTRYFVFFKAKDVDVLNAAFKEFLGKELQKSKMGKIHEKIRENIEKVVSRERSRQKSKTREAEL
jgi:hypothetical protein